MPLREKPSKRRGIDWCDLAAKNGEGVALDPTEDIGVNELFGLPLRPETTLDEVTCRGKRAEMRSGLSGGKPVAVSDLLRRQRPTAANVPDQQAIKWIVHRFRETQWVPRKGASPRGRRGRGRRPPLQSSGKLPRRGADCRLRAREPAR